MASKQLVVTLVFDSGQTHTAHYPSHHKQGRITIKFSPEGVCADKYILELLSHVHKKSTTVVTSDRHLAREAQSRGAKTLPVENFLALLDKKKGTQQKSMNKPDLSNPEYDAYLRKIFEDRY